MPLKSSEQRKANFKLLRYHPWLGKIFKRLTTDEVALCERVLDQQGDLDKGAFEQFAQRLFMDDAKRPKHSTEICELLICANSAL